MSKRLLQFANVTLAIWTLFRAGLTLVEGMSNPILGSTGPPVPAVDSNLRFLAGIGIAMAVILIWLTPSITTHTVEFRVVWSCRFLGGLGRVVSLVAVGATPTPMLITTMSEVAIIPFLLYWQGRVAATASRRAVIRASPPLPPAH